MALLAFALALALQQTPEAAAAPAADAQAAPAAVSTAPQPPRGAVEGPVPNGAPEDDYGLVNWCRGALTGHMALYEVVKPTLNPAQYPLDEEQMAAGREYLRLYEEAVAAADRASARSRRAEATAAMNRGLALWAPADTASADQRKWGYLTWQLPGRCETAAIRLRDSAQLMAPAIRGGSAAPVPTGAARPAAQSSGGALPVDEEPAAETPAPSGANSAELRGPQ